MMHHKGLPADLQAIRITKAIETDLEDIMSLIRLCTAENRRKKVATWDEHYPTRELIESDVNRGYVNIAHLDERLIGCVTITPDEKDEVLASADLPWRGDPDSSVMICRLAILPELQGRGLGGYLFDQALLEAIQEGYTAIRLEVLSSELRLKRFYGSRGFLQLGSIVYDREPYDVFEHLTRDVTIELLEERETDKKRQTHILELAQSIRKRVFVQEQQVALSIEQDGLDLESTHLVLLTNGVAAGTLRLRRGGQELYLQRLAVLSHFRRRGFAALLIEKAVDLAKEWGYSDLKMHAQYYLCSYYTSFGFQAVGKPFYEAGIKHIEMSHSL